MRKINLITKVTLVVSLLVSAGLSVITLYALNYFEDRLKESISQQQFSLVSAMAEEIDSKVVTAHNLLVALAAHCPPDVAADPAKAQEFLDTRPAIRVIFDNDLSIFAPSGVQVASDPRSDTVGRNYSFRQYFKETMRTRRPVISRPLISAQEHRHPIIMFTAPILDRQGRVTGILTGSLDLLKDNFLGKLGKVHLGKGGYFFLYDTDRTMVMHPDRKRILQKDVAPGVNRLYDLALSGFDGTGETVNSRGVHVLASFKRLKKIDWILAANYLQEEAYAPIGKARRNFLCAFLLASCGSVLIIALFMRHLTAPLRLFIRHVDEMTEKKQALEPIAIDTRDEICTLGQAFNRMIGEVNRQRQAALDQQEFTLNLLQHAAVPIFVIDSERRVIIWNRAMEMLTGTDAVDMVGTRDPWRAVYRERRPTLAEEVLERALERVGTGAGSEDAEEVMRTEKWFPAMNGHDRFLCFEAAAVRNAAGEIIAVVETAQDLTSRRRTEESLRKLSLAIEQAPVSVLITDREGTIEYVNPHFCRVTGYSAEEAVGRNARLVNSGWHTPSFFGALWDTILSGDDWRGEVRNRRKNGELYWESVCISPVKSSSGEITHFVAVREEITGRKWAEDALRKSEEQIRLLLESTAEAIIGMNLEGECTFANRACAHLLGYRDPEELIGKRMRALVHHTLPEGPDYYGADCAIYRALSGEEGIHVDDELFWRADGSSFVAEYWSYPQWEGGKVVGAVVTFFDISERKRAEDELHRAIAAAEAATRAKSEFLANMSHEIRTPINAFMGMLHLLQQTPLNEKQQGFLVKAHDAAGMLLRIINDILDFSKIEAGKLEVERVPFSLSAVLANLYDFTTATLKDKPVHFSVSSASEIPDRLIGDPLRLGQVLLNLTNNAVKFTPQGSVTVRVETMALSEEEVGIRFQVQDTGIGMAAEKQEKLFNAFTQEDSSTTRRFGGTGLGLAISRQLVEKMGGRIWVASEQGQGSTFSFTLSFGIAGGDEAAEAAGAGTSRPRPESLAGMSLLVAEDNPLNREVAKAVLVGAGAQVEFAEHGVEAVRLVLHSGQRYHAVLMDVHMPVMDGLEATRRIRAEKGFAHLPIIAMTASALVGERHLCLAAGMNDQVNKPVDVPELLATLIRWVGHPGSPPETADAGGMSAISGIEVDAALKRLGNPHLLAKLLKSFRQENLDTLAAIDEALSAEDAGVARRLIHTVKGVGGNLGAERLARAALALEDALHSEAGDRLQWVLKNFQRELLLVLESIRVWEAEEGSRFPEGEPESPEEVDAVAVLPLVQQLATLLETDNLDAIEAWEKLKPLLSSVDTRRIEAPLQVLDFAEALRALRLISDAWFNHAVAE